MKPIEIAKRRSMTPARMKRIWERVGGTCWFCTKPVEMRGPGVRYDHKLPLELGGSDDDVNIFPLHTEPCDKIKCLADWKRITKAKAQSGESKTRKKKAIPSRGFEKPAGGYKWAKRPMGGRRFTPRSD